MPLASVTSASIQPFLPAGYAVQPLKEGIGAPTATCMTHLPLPESEHDWHQLNSEHLALHSPIPVVQSFCTRRTLLPAAWQPLHLHPPAPRLAKIAMGAGVGAGVGADVSTLFQQVAA